MFLSSTNAVASYWLECIGSITIKSKIRALKEGPRGVITSIKMTAGKELLRDKDFALKMLAINPLVLHILDRKLRKDKDIISAAKKISTIDVPHP